MIPGSRTLHGVLYAEDFDLPDVIPAESPAGEIAERSVEPIVLEPTFSLVDLQSASERGVEEGRYLEREEFSAGLEARRTDALCTIGDALRQARADHARIVQAEAGAVTHAILSSISALLPHFAAAQALPESVALLSMILPAMEGEAMLQVKAHSLILDSLRNDLEIGRIAQSIPLEWIAVDTMQPGDISLKWRDGTMIRDTTILCNRIGSMLSEAIMGRNADSKEVGDHDDRR